MNNGRAGKTTNNQECKGSARPVLIRSTELQFNSLTGLLVKIFGEKMISLDSGYKLIAHKFRDKLYISSFKKVKQCQA